MKIVEKKLNSFERVELQDMMIDMLQESYDTCPDDSKSFYDDCQFDDYFDFGRGLQEIWNEDEKIGEGIICGSTAYILNDETRPDFEELFEIARGNIEIEQCDDTADI